MYKFYNNDHSNGCIKTLIKKITTIFCVSHLLFYLCDDLIYCQVLFNNDRCY